MITQSINLNLIPGAVPPRIKISQYDQGSRTLTFTLYNGTSSFTASGVTAKIQGTKPDRKGFVYDASYSSGTVTANLTRQMSCVAGDVTCEIVLYKNGEVLGTGNFILEVEASALADDVDTSETVLPGYIDAAERAAAEAATSATSAAASATAAAQSATAAAASATSANNAKTAAQTAQEAAAASATSAESAKTAAAASATSAESAKTSAMSSQVSASISAGNADASATRAQESAGRAMAQAEAAARSASDAAQSSSIAGQSATSASQSATSATASANSANLSKNAAQLAAQKAEAAELNPPYIGVNGDWYVYDLTLEAYKDSGVEAQGDDGNGIASITKTGTSGLVDTYTITYTDGTASTFTVTNGADATLPAGGTTGQALLKLSSTASDAGWGDVDIPVATSQAAGKVKPDGTTITIDANGVISAVGGMPADPLPIANGGTGNTAGYIRTGVKANTTVGTGSTAEGSKNTSSGAYSHAEGYSTTASNDAAHTEGVNTTASATASHAEGASTTASGMYSHAEGLEAVASGDHSHAGGLDTVAGYSNQTVVGEYNDNKSTTLFEVGNGNANTRSNALEVYSNGNVIAAGTISDANGALSAVEANPSGSASTDLTKLKVGSSIYSVPSVPVATTSVAGKVKPDGTTITVDANGTISSAGGLPVDPLPVANGGTGNTAGYIRTGKLSGSTMGTKATAEGDYNTSSGNYSHAEGYRTVASGAYSHAGGLYTTAAQNYQTVVGIANSNKTDTLFEVGNGTGSTSADRSNAFEVYSNGNVKAYGTVSDANGALSAVTANPSGSASTALTKLKVGSTTYSVSGDASGKADKVSGATNGNLAGLDSNGNLTDSGKAASNVVMKSNTSGLLKNDGTVDTNSYSTTTVVANPSGTASTDLTKLKVGSTTYSIPSGGSGSGNTKSKTLYSISSGSWSSSKNSDGFYTYTLTLYPTLSTYYAPTVSIAGSTTSSQPTDTHRRMYGMLERVNLSASNALVLYAPIKPTSTFYIFVDGVNA